MGRRSSSRPHGLHPAAKDSVVVLVLVLVMFDEVVPIFAQPADTRELGHNDASAVAVDESHDEDADGAGIRL